MAEEPSFQGGRRRRRLLSLFFILHWGAVGLYVLPSTREAVEPLPDWMEAPAAMVAPVVYQTAPLWAPYLDLTGARQHWTLFAPWPADWNVSVQVVPYFAVPEAGDSTWRADTLILEGPEQVPYPHHLRHRTYRILFNMGYARWEHWYRPHFARQMCRALRDGEGRGPEGVELVARWERIPVPWTGPPADTVYMQRMGGYDCAAVGGDAPAEAGWERYGLPDLVSPDRWPLVRERMEEAGDSVPGVPEGVR